MGEWIFSMVLCSAVCGAAVYFLSGSPSQKTVKLLCGLIMSAVVVMPLGSLWKDFQAFGEESFIFSEYDNTLTTEDASLCESLIRQTAEQRLSELLQEEMQRRLGRDDFSLGVNAEGTAWIRCGEDFPQEEAKWILSALLGGCEVQITGGEENNGG